MFIGKVDGLLGNWEWMMCFVVCSGRGVGSYRNGRHCCFSASNGTVVYVVLYKYNNIQSNTRMLVYFVHSSLNLYF